MQERKQNRGQNPVEKNKSLDASSVTDLAPNFTGHTHDCLPEGRNHLHISDVACVNLFTKNRFLIYTV